MYYDETKLKNHLSTCCVGKNLLIFDCTASTNTYLKEHHQQLSHGTVVVSASQTAGKGSKGRSWVAPLGSGIAMSVLLKPQVSFDYSMVTLCAGLCVCRAIKKTTGLSPSIKWPNDIVIDGKKVCGILCESIFVGATVSIVVGIGINIHTTQAYLNQCQLPHATSLAIAGCNDIAKEALAAEILNSLEVTYLSICNNQNIGEFLEEIKANCITLNKEVKIITKDEEFIATATGIDLSGKLIVDTQAGAQHLSVSEVSVRGLYGYVAP